MDPIPPSPTRRPLTTFTKFPLLSTELRHIIWRHALLPRIVHLKQKRVEQPVGAWWYSRVRSDITMWSTDEELQDKLAQPRTDSRRTRSESNYGGDDLLDDPAHIDRLDDDVEEWKLVKAEAEEEALCCDRLNFHRRTLSLSPEIQYQDEYEDEYQDEYDTDDSDSEREESEPVIGDEVDRPRGLWFFITEMPTPVLLRTCHESRVVALERYQLAFSSLGRSPQIYFDPLRDTLFIDHETFVGRYEDLPSLVSRYLLPSDIEMVRMLAIYGLGVYQREERRDNHDETYDEWLVETSVLFANIDKVTDAIAPYLRR